MRIVPSLPPPTTIAEEGLKVQSLTRVKPAKPVQARTLPPPVVQHHARVEASSDLAEQLQEEKRHDTYAYGERRTYCRRIEHLPVLIELRSDIARRRRTQRGEDVTEHVDEQA
jgi:hypothetical protein